MHVVILQWYSADLWELLAVNLDTRFCATCG
jgi:hypothetical protein